MSITETTADQYALVPAPVQEPVQTVPATFVPVTIRFKSGKEFTVTGETVGHPNLAIVPRIYGDEDGYRFTSTWDVRQVSTGKQLIQAPKWNTPIECMRLAAKHLAESGVDWSEPVDDAAVEVLRAARNAAVAAWKESDPYLGMTFHEYEISL